MPRKGQQQTRGAKRKMSLAKSGKHFSPKTEFKKGHRVNVGKKRKPLSMEHRKAMSLARKGNIPWNKGIRKSIHRDKHNMYWEYVYWRNLVFQRDNYSCYECKTRGGYLEAHHIKSWAKFPELRYEVSNGLTLCKKCHNKIPKRR